MIELAAKRSMNAARAMTEALDKRNIGGWLTDNASKAAGKVALKFEDGRQWTYEDLSLWSDAIAVSLRDEHQVGRGDRVAFLGFNHPAMVALLFACAKLGAILVPLNWRLTANELAYIAEDCGPNVLFFDAEHNETALVAADAAPGCVAQSVERLEATASAVLSNAAGSLDDPLLIIYTSGTTGRPKGAVLPQQALLTNALNSIDLHEMTADDTVLVVLPLFHVGGLNISLTPALFTGATVELHPRFDPAATLRAIEMSRPQVLVLVPATMMAVMKQSGWERADTSSLRMLTTGSMVVPVELIAAFEAKGISVVQVYGSTETCPIAAYSRPGEGKSNPYSTGKAALHSAVRIVGPTDGAVVEPHIDGEIEVRGAHVMQGYWSRPDETSAAFNGDWHRTGDIGHLDEEGNLYFRERAKHVIVSGGENIYPAEIERVLGSIPGVAEVAVCGVDDEKWGEVPAAGIVLSEDPSDVGEDLVQQVLVAELARFKHPKILKFLAQLPRNAMGKVVHDELRQVLLEE